jgi:hypothetical protein
VPRKVKFTAEFAEELERAGEGIDCDLPDDAESSSQYRPSALLSARIARVREVFSRKEKENHGLHEFHGLISQMRL